MNAFDAVGHWERVYTEKSPESVSWFQRSPDVSLELIESAGGQRIVDAGAGASVLADRLLERGREVWLVDVSRRALEVTRARLGDRARGVRFTAADLTRPVGEFEPGWADVWHDRAVLHFLTSDAQVRGYAENLARVLRPGGHAIVATFAPDGPVKCSGLDVRRQNPAEVRAALGVAVRLELVAERVEEHVTPWGAVQRFAWGVFRRAT